MSHRACHFVLREKSHRIFSAWKIKKNAGVPVYIENTQKEQETGTQVLFIFL